MGVAHPPLSAALGNLGPPGAQTVEALWVFLEAGVVLGFFLEAIPNGKQHPNNSRFTHS